MKVLKRDGIDVVMETDKMLVKFYSNYGGTPLAIYKKTPSGLKLVSNPHAGAGSSIAWNTGQDATQASNNGIDFYPISRFDDSHTWKNSYYIREQLFDVTNCIYGIGGAAPFFWVSLDAIDDTIPPDARGDNGWSTAYHDFLNLGANFYRGFGTPIAFAPRGAVTSGIIFPGNEIENLKRPNKPWTERLLRIGGGCFAHKCRISLKDASADAIAGIMIRRSVLNVAGADINTAYNSPGNQLNFNKNGNIELVRIGYGVVWSYPTPELVKPFVNSASGVAVELRSFGWDVNGFEIWINGQLAAYAREPHIGENFGYFAQCSGGKIVFWDRAWFDMGSSFTAKYSINPEGLFSIDTKVTRTHASPGLYRAHMPAIFFNTAIPLTKPNSILLWNRQSVRYNWNQLDQKYPNQFGMYKGIIPNSDVYYLWLGTNDCSEGLFAVNCNTVTGYAMQQAHVVGFSPIPESCENVPLMNKEVDFRSLWGVEVPSNLKP